MIREVIREWAHRYREWIHRTDFDPQAEAAARWVSDCRQVLCEQKGALLCSRARIARLSTELPAIIRAYMLILERIALEEHDLLAASSTGFLSLVGRDLVIGDRILVSLAEVDVAIAEDLKVDHLANLLPLVHAFVASSPELWDDLLIPLPH